MATPLDDLGTRIAAARARLPVADLGEAQRTPPRWSSADTQAAAAIAVVAGLPRSWPLLLRLALALPLADAARRLHEAPTRRARA